MVLGCVSLFFQAGRGGNRNLEYTVAVVSGGSGSLCIPGSFAADTGHRSFTFELVGAGDMKLMAVFAVWLGFEKTERSLLQDFF
ncbi:MAG: prepilin peptidase [Enterocloster sp.]